MDAHALSPGWQTVPAVIVPGYQVASGTGGNPRFPGGTLRMQAPHFAARGLDLTPFHVGTINVQISPRRYRVEQPRITLRGIRWHPTAAVEDFSFFDVQLLRPEGPALAGLIYYPRPETKPADFKIIPGVLELLLPFVPGLRYGDEVLLAVPAEQMVIEEPPFPAAPAVS